MIHKIKPIIAIAIIILAIHLLPQGTKAQNVPGYAYTYDASGNRLTRTYQTVHLHKIDSVVTQAVIDNKHDVTIFPNPTSGILKVDITNMNNKVSAKIYVVDFAGKPLFNLDLKSQENIVDLSKYPVGAYFMTVVINDKTQTWKIMIMD